MTKAVVEHNTNWAKNLLTGGHQRGDDDIDPHVKASPRALQPHAQTAARPAPALVLPSAAEKQALAKALLARRLQKRSRFTDEQKAKIFGLYLQGHDVEDIGAKFGVSGMTIRKLVDEAIVEGGCELPAKKTRAKRKG